MNAFLNSHPRRHSSVLIGMLLGDHISITAPNMSKAWEALREMNPVLSQQRRYNRLPVIELEFPLLYGCYDKAKIWAGYDFPEQTLEIWKKLRLEPWTCHNPIKNNESWYVPCKKCRRLHIVTGKQIGRAHV